MKNNFLTHKLFLILALFLLVLFVFTTTIFASSDVITVSTNTYVQGSLEKEVEVHLPSGYGTDYSYYVFSCYLSYSEPSRCYKLHYAFLCSEQSFYYNNSWQSSEGTPIYYKCSWVDFSSIQDELLVLDLSSFSISDFEVSLGSFSTSEATPARLVCSNFDVYTDSSKTELVFQGAPQPTHLAQVVEQAKPEETIQEIVEILPIVIIVIVGLISLWKALQLLLRLLKKA